MSDKDIEIKTGLGHSELYERYCFNCGYDFKNSKVRVDKLDNCPECDEPIRPPLNLIKGGWWT